MIYMFDKNEILKIESEIVDMEIDDWFSIDDNTDLNISVRDGRITLDIYKVKDGKTCTKKYVTLFSIDINEAQRKLNCEKEYKYIIKTGTVQCYVYRNTPFFMYFFGKAEYDKTRPILTDSIKKKAQLVVNKLNNLEITEEYAKKLLDKIYW